MKTLACVMLVAAALAAPAKDFPLEFKTLRPEEVTSFPGVSPVCGRLQKVKPKALKKEPKPICGRPLYGELNGGTTNAYVFRVEESKEGKGYDRLLIDLNQNGDLTDDPVIEGQIKTKPDKPLPKFQDTTFWPIPVSADRMIGSWRPIYRGELFVNTGNVGKGENVYIGLLSVYAGWYLETTVEVEGFKQKVGVCDSAAQMRLGNEWRPTISSGSGNWLSGTLNWSFNPGDCFLQDTDGSGRFEGRPLNNEVTPFSPFRYIGPHPCKVSLSPDFKSLQVEKWAEPLAEVTVRPHGEQVQGLSLAWEQVKGQWRLLSLTVADGKVKVPPGKYRLESCTVVARPDRAETIVAVGRQFRMDTPMIFAVGKTNTLCCGPPLRVETAAIKLKAQDWMLRAQETLRGQQMAPLDPKVDSEFVLFISAEIRGVYEDTYMFFRPQDFKGVTKKASFTVADVEGKVVGSGNLEFG